MLIEKGYMQLRRLEHKYYLSILNALNSQVLSFINYKRVDDQPLKASLEAIYTEVATAEARRTAKALKSLRVKEDQWLKDVLEYLNYYLMRLSVTPVTAQTRAMIQQILVQSIEQGLSEPVTVKLMMDLLEMNKARALRIARTEVVRAVNFGSMMAAHDSEFQYTKKWIAVDDARTRRTHRHEDGQVRDFYELFSNGLLFPGDPNGSPKEVINCRCRLGFSIKRDAQGRPMKKRPLVTFPRILFLAGLETGLELLINNLYE